MLFITGDTHGKWVKRLNSSNFPDGNMLTKDDIVMVTGDFGIWHDSEEERYNLDWLEDKPFTTVFCDGNHENFDRLDDMDVEEWNGGKVHKIRPSVIHLMRGQVYDIQEHTFFVFGGGQTHDIKDGILDRNDPDFQEKKKWLDCKVYPLYRINHESWWEREQPSEEEMQEGRDNLKRHNYKVDYLITHSPGIVLGSQLGFIENDLVSKYIQEIRNKTEFKAHYFGHMHVDIPLYWDRAVGVYEKIIRII